MRQYDNHARYTLQKCTPMKAAVLFLVACADLVFVLGRQVRAPPKAGAASFADRLGCAGCW